MENLEHDEKKPSNAEITSELLEHSAALKKKNQILNDKLNKLKEECDKLLHPEKGEESKH